MDNKLELRGKVVVITGASSGFGKGAARQFAQAGAHVALAARRSELIEELAQECRAFGVDALAIPTDVSRPEQVERLALETATRFGRVDIWFNNAGSAALGRFEDIPIEEHQQVIATNLLGTIYGSHYAIRQFQQQGWGILINMASVVGKVPSPYYSSYTASKFGVVGLSASIRLELEANKEEHIRVCTVMPTSMDTPFFDHEANYSGHEPTPIPPLYDPQEVIDAVLKLAVEPEDEVTVGRMGTMSALAHKVAPGLIEKQMTKQHHEALKKQPAAEDTPGGVRQPAPTGTDVRGGRLQK